MDKEYKKMVRMVWKASLYTEKQCIINRNNYIAYSVPRNKEQFISKQLYYYWNDLVIEHSINKDIIRDIVFKRFLNSLS